MFSFGHKWYVLEHVIIMLLSSFIFFTADNVTITGSGGTLPQTPLMNTFVEYTQDLDSWTYDGRSYSQWTVSPPSILFIL